MNGTISNFTELPAQKQRAIVMRSGGSTHAEIADELGVAKKTVDSWFDITGSLFLPMQSYNAHLGDEALASAKDLIREYAPKALQTLRDLSQPGHPPAIRVRAAQVLASPALVAASRELELEPVKPAAISPELQEAISEEWRVIEAGRAALAIGAGQPQEGEVVT